MAEYIDRTQLEPDTEWSEYEDDFISYSQSQINSMPTADVIERSEYGKMVESFKAMVEIKNENLIAMRDKYYTLEKEYAELKVNIKKAIEEIEQVKSVMNEEIIEHDRKDLINFINGINQCLIILKENIGE